MTHNFTTDGLLFFLLLCWARETLGHLRWRIPAHFCKSPVWNSCFYKREAAIHFLCAATHSLRFPLSHNYHGNKGLVSTSWMSVFTEPTPEQGLFSQLLNTITLLICLTSRVLRNRGGSTQTLYVDKGTNTTLWKYPVTKVPLCKCYAEAFQCNQESAQSRCWADQSFLRTESGAESDLLEE